MECKFSNLQRFEPFTYLVLKENLLNNIYKKSQIVRLRTNFLSEIYTCSKRSASGLVEEITFANIQLSASNLTEECIELKKKKKEKSLDVG